MTAVQCLHLRKATQVLEILPIKTHPCVTDSLQRWRPVPTCLGWGSKVSETKFSAPLTTLHLWDPFCPQLSEHERCSSTHLCDGTHMGVCFANWMDLWMTGSTVGAEPVCSISVIPQVLSASVLLL